MSRYAIGIDLGTTHCTVAYLDLEGGGELAQLAIPQYIAAGVIGEGSLLPSALLFPLEEERSLSGGERYCVGQYARDRAPELPDRVVTSAKSWLCHTGIDRRKLILPLGFPEGIGPIEVLGKLLAHIRSAWETKMEGVAFDEQQILVTVPASFDPSARELVLEAVQQAGYPEVVFMEEPQAAFYAWLHRHQEEWRKLLKVGDTILVVDIGGGTTDLSLIEVSEREGEMALERILVGDHLLLGGDNMDLALAHLAAHKLGIEIDGWQMDRLIHACRQAKEQLLGDVGAESVSVVIEGRGSGLIGGSLMTELTREEVVQLVVDGFFPIVDADERPKVAGQAGLRTMGLPYSSDPRVTAHLAQFLSRGEERMRPTALLFNGGAVKPSIVRQRLVDQLNLWNEQPVFELPGGDFDCAVSRGAAYYGLARQGGAMRIRSGTSRCYFIGVEEAIPAIPGLPTPVRAICVAPFGMEEGSEVELSGMEFALLLGEPATFRFFSLNQPALPGGEPVELGTCVRKWKDLLVELPSIEAQLPKEGEERTVVVTLRANATELGLLELCCRSRDGREFKFSFNIREEQRGPLAASSSAGSLDRLLDSAKERRESPTP